MKYIALFGPPGAGKSTLITEARKQGITAYDLEKYSQDTRLLHLKAILKKTDAQLLLFSAADLTPTDFPKDTVCVLLLPSPKSAYLQQLQERDLRIPIKSGQDGSRVYDQFRNWQKSFDIVYRKLTVPQTALAQILALARTTEPHIKE